MTQRGFDQGHPNAGWRRVGRLVDLIEPVTDAAWDLLAAVVLDTPEVLAEVA